MSFDVNIATTCNHKVFKEFVILSEDRHSLRVSKPMASTLSATIQVYRSGNLLPTSSYDITTDPLTIDVNRPKMIYLKKKNPSIDDFFEVTYLTLNNFCPKCAGLKIIDDIQYTMQGDFAQIRDEALLVQNLEKFTITTLGSNIFHSFIGTDLVGLLGRKIADINYITSKIVGEINTTLEKLMDLQGQYESTGRVVTDGEILSEINNIDVAQDEVDPTIMRVYVEATARSGKPLEFTQLMRRII